MDKNDYYFSFKIKLEGLFVAKLESRVGLTRVNIKIKIKIMIIIV